MYNRPLAGICVGTALFVCAADGAPEAPAEVPPSDGAMLIVNVDAGEPLQAGSTIDLVGDGFMADANVRIVMYSDPIPVGESVADEEGVIEASVEVPNVNGAHTLVMLGNDPDGDARVLSEEIVITGATSSTLPATGTGVGLFVAIGVAAVLVGVALTRGARLRGRGVDVS